MTKSFDKEYIINSKMLNPLDRNLFLSTMYGHICLDDILNSKRFSFLSKVEFMLERCGLSDDEKLELSLKYFNIVKGFIINSDPAYLDFELLKSAIEINNNAVDGTNIMHIINKGVNICEYSLKNDPGYNGAICACAVYFLMARHADIFSDEFSNSEKVLSDCCFKVIESAWLAVSDFEIYVNFEQSKIAKSLLQRDFINILLTN